MKDGVETACISNCLTEPNDVLAIATAVVDWEVCFFVVPVPVIALTAGKDEDKGKHRTRNHCQKIGLIDGVDVLEFEISSAEIVYETCKDLWIGLEGKVIFSA